MPAPRESPAGRAQKQIPITSQYVRGNCIVWLDRRTGLFQTSRVLTTDALPDARAHILRRRAREAAMRIGRIVAMITLSIGVTATANAAELFTPPLRTVGGVFICQAVNVGAAAQNIRIEFWGFRGSRLAYTTAGPTSSANVLESTYSAPRTGSTTVYCKIIADGASTSVRGQLSVYSYHDQNSPPAAVAAQ
jgi:hypothetical protein